MTEQKIPKVLYLDDENINLQLFRLTFLGEVEVILSESSTEALEILKKSTDLTAVISDMRMPIMSGLEFVEQAKTINGEVPYFILSGYDLNPEIKEALDSDLINGFIQKPFDKENILSILGKYI